MRRAAQAVATQNERTSPPAIQGGQLGFHE